jgi:hypothetical protein
MGGISSPVKTNKRVVAFTSEKLGCLILIDLRNYFIMMYNIERLLILILVFRCSIILFIELFHDEVSTIECGNSAFYGRVNIIRPSEVQ